MSLALDPVILSRLPRLRELRRDIHQHPELMFDLPRTSKLVAQKLREFGFDQVIEGIARTGVVGILYGKLGKADSPERTIMFRADMDALPIEENTGAPYSSKHSSVMHACGHDGHTTMLLGAAEILANSREFDGTLIFCFQPAEEGEGGAKVMIEEGLLTRFPVKAAYALHNWPGMPVGQFGVVRGPAMASVDGFTITVKGRGGHAAKPEKSRDPIVCSASMITSIQTIVSRCLSPFDPAVVSITSIHGGEAWNVIPDEVSMRCNLRCFSEEVGKTLIRELERICQSTGEAHGCNVTLERPAMTPYPPTVNHPVETELAIKAMQTVVGEENVNTELSPVMGSEDFAFVLREVPGAYIFIGNGDSAPLHNPSYDFSDDSLGYGVAYWVQLARTTLPLNV